MSTRIDQWNERYRTGQQVFDTPSPLVVEFTNHLIPGSALDLASGPGRNALYLAEHGWRVTAIDGSPVAIDLLLDRARHRKLALEARVLDLEMGRLRVLEPGFDLILSCYYFQRSLIAPMKSSLRRGGLLIAIAHLSDANQPEGTGSRANPGELRSLFEGWRILHYREGDPGESCHRRAVAELVAQKPA